MLLYLCAFNDRSRPKTSQKGTLKRKHEISELIIALGDKALAGLMLFYLYAVI